MCRYDRVCNVQKMYCFILAYFVPIFWVWITTTQKLQWHTLAQIHKASQIRSNHLGHK